MLLGPYCVRQLTAHHMKDFLVLKDGPCWGKVCLLGYYKKDQFRYADLFEIKINLRLTKLIYSMPTPVLRISVFQTVVKAQYQQLIWLPARELLQVSLLWS